MLKPNVNFFVFVLHHVHTVLLKTFEMQTLYFELCLNCAFIPGPL